MKTEPLSLQPKASVMASAVEYRTYRFGSFTLDLERGALLTTDGTDMPLRPKSFALLRLLVENAGRLLSRETIMEALWPNLYVTEDNVTQCIHDIRSVLGSKSNQILRTLPRRGYVFTSDVIAGPSADPPPHINDSNRSTPADNANLRDHEPPIAKEGRVQPQPLEALRPYPSAGCSKLPRLSVMMAPLRNLGVPKDHEYLVEGIPEDIITDLPQHRGPVVIGFPETLGRSHDSASLREIAYERGVGYIIQGSIRGTVDRLALSLQLIDVETAVQRWSGRFDIDLSGTTDTRNEMINRVTLILALKLIEDVNRRIEALPPEDWSPDDLVMRGTALLYRPLTAQNSLDANRQASLECFEQALAHAPDSIPAKVGIAAILIMNVSDGQSPHGGPDEIRTEQLLTDVLRVNGEAAIAHTLMGVLRRQQGRFNDSLIELRVATGLAPNQPWTIANLGFALALVGQPDAGLPLIERSIRLSPHDFYAPLSHGWLGLCHLQLGNTEEALSSLRTARAMNSQIHFIHVWLAAALGLKGELDEARAVLKHALVMHPDLPQIILRWRANPEHVALFDRTVYAGLLRAGLPATGAETN